MSGPGFHSLHPDEGMAAVQEIFREVLLESQLQLIPAMVTGDHVRWDSMANVEILMACESRWGIRFRASQFDRILTVGDLVQAVIDSGP
jgi:acyl carrier protein